MAKTLTIHLMKMPAASDPDEIWQRALVSGKRTLIFIVVAAIMLQAALMIFF